MKIAILFVFSYVRWLREIWYFKQTRIAFQLKSTKRLTFITLCGAFAFFKFFSDFFFVILNKTEYYTKKKLFFFLNFLLLFFSDDLQAVALHLTLFNLNIIDFITVLKSILTLVMNIVVWCGA